MKSIFRNMGNMTKGGVLFIMSVFLLQSCNKEIETGVDPYAGGREPLGVSFLDDFPEPEIARPNEEVRFSVKGLKPFEDRVTFFINDTETEIISIADSSIVVRVPEQISSGTAMVQIDQQVFTGPLLYIDGQVSVDRNFRMINGFNGFVDFLHPLSNGYIVGGAFTDFEGEAVPNSVYRNGIHFVGTNGETASNLTFGEGGMVVRSLAAMPNGKYVVAGLFNAFDGKQTDYIAMLHPNGRLDTATVDVINTTPDNPLNSVDTVSAFNGGVIGGQVLRVFATGDSKVIAVGNFTHHRKIDYSYSSRDQRSYRSTRANDVIRMHADGTLDSTYQYNHTGFNGMITDAIMQKDGKLVIVGLFNQYNNQRVSNIVRLNTDGTLDNSFSVGVGTDHGVARITYHEPSERIVLAGIFRTYNGQEANGLAIVNEDGTLDTSFKLGDIGTGNVMYGKILNNGKVLVNGLFDRYNGVPRSNLLLLESDGTALQEFNNFGVFSGRVSDVQETTSSLGRPALLLGGSFYQVDGVSVGNVVRLEVR